MKSVWLSAKTTLPRRVLSLGGRFTFDDDGQTPNTQLATLPVRSGTAGHFRVAQPAFGKRAEVHQQENQVRTGRGSIAESDRQAWRFGRFHRAQGSPVQLPFRRAEPQRQRPAGRHPRRSLVDRAGSHGQRVLPCRHVAFGGRSARRHQRPGQ